MERITELTPAYDKRAEGKGQHCVELLMLLKGDKGVVQFRLFTGWDAGSICKPADYNWKTCRVNTNSEISSLFPMPADLGYHSPTPRYEGQTSMGTCRYLDGKPCYYDGSSLEAYRIYSILVHEGSEAVWKELEKYYKELFEEDANDKH